MIQKDRIYDVIQKNIDTKYELRDNIYKFQYRVDYQMLKKNLMNISNKFDFILKIIIKISIYV